MSLDLVCLSGDATPQRLAIDGPLQLGRDPHCDVRLLDQQASRFHARLGEGELRDLGSANGTLIDGQRIATVALRDGLLFTIGGCRFTVVDAGASGADTRLVADDGAGLDCIGSREARPWRRGDHAEPLAALHAAVQLLTRSAARERPALLAQAAASAVAAPRAALVLGDRVVCATGATMSPALARRLAGGERARLLVLGRELVGRTIASEAVGSAIAAPVATAGHLVLCRGLDAEPLAARELELIAHLAAETAHFFTRADEAEDGLVGTSNVMRDLRARIVRLARADAPVLITGASGTGKELVARALHRRSGRSRGPFIAVNGAALAEQLAESELFGHVKGAYTGADRDHPGRFRDADGGILFLDEVGELSLPVQAKLLRALQEGVIAPVGGRDQAVDVRILAATNRDLATAVAAGRFRADLLYRLDVLRITTPGLDERREDLPALCRHLLQRAAEELGLPPSRDCGPFIAAAQQRDWPGHVRQLGNACTRAMALAEDGVPRLEDTAAAVQLPAIPADAPFPTLAQVEAAHVAAALTRCGGNRSAAARLLGISRPTLLRKIAES